MRILVNLFFTLTISFAESDFILNGAIVSQKEYNQANSLHLVNGDTFSDPNEENIARNWAGDIDPSSVNQNAYSSSTDRNSDEFDIYLNFDEQNPGCSWGSDVPPSNLYQSEFGITFANGPSLVAENVNFGLRMKKEDPEVTAKKVDEWLDIVGLKGFGNTPTYQLSGGMQQRVALARCLINDPDLILMDEPLGALDALTREKMQSLVLKIWKETGKTIILITHSVEEALLLGERLYVMAPRPGRIHKEYNLPFALMGLKEDLREIKKNKDFSAKREEILEMIWNMEEEIMGKDI